MDHELNDDLPTRATLVVLIGRLAHLSFKRQGEFHACAVDDGRRGHWQYERFVVIENSLFYKGNDYDTITEPGFNGIFSGMSVN